MGGCWNREQECDCPLPPNHPDFDRQINPITISMADYAHPIYWSPGFLDLPTAL